jgi:NitT/TauT family transport system substrate-binding protein
LGIAGNGNLFLLTKDQAVKSVKDVDGKTISCAGQGATPEYMMKYLMKKNSVNATLDFSTPNPDIAAALIEGKFDYALVPEPFATVAQTKDPEIRRISISEEFKAIEGSDFPMTLLVVNANYAKKHKKEIKRFMADFEKASEWTIKNPAESGKLVEKHNLGLKAPVAAKAIPNAAYTWKKAGKGKSEIEKLLGIFLENSPEAIGGKLPDGKFYY